jgi:predicted RNase H-like nuclease
MHSVLGIDAAWTTRQPSGVALVTGAPGQWTLRAVAPSYSSFIEASKGRRVDWTASAVPSDTADFQLLLDAAEAMVGQRPSVVAVDMPLALEPFSGRRAADREVSRAYGSRKCSTHSPTAERPGPVSERLSATLEAAGYPLATAAHPPGLFPRSIEVYPHPALIHLLGRGERVPYKVSKSRKYWPEASSSTRIERLLREFSAILDGLASRIDDVRDGLRLPESVPRLSPLKRYEDGVDAIVCAWVGVCYLEGKAVPYGDSASAIWVPGNPAPWPTAESRSEP